MALVERRYKVVKNGAEAHGVVFPIKDFDYSDIELLSNEEIEKRYLEYMGTKCNTLFIDTTKLPKK